MHVFHWILFAATLLNLWGFWEFRKYRIQFHNMERSNTPRVGRIITVHEKTDDTWRQAQHYSLENDFEGNTHIFIGEQYRVDIATVFKEEPKDQEFYERMFK